jgi:hypothetical protein
MLSYYNLKDYIFYCSVNNVNHLTTFININHNVFIYIRNIYNCKTHSCCDKFKLY